MVAVRIVFALNAPAEGCVVVFRGLSFAFTYTITRSANTLTTEKSFHIPSTSVSNVSCVPLNVTAYDYYRNQRVNLSAEPAVVLLEEELPLINPIGESQSLSKMEISTYV